MDNNSKKQQLKDLLKIHYGFGDFRPGQSTAIDNILKGENTVVIMPTGGGKSLIYQLPSLILDGVAIVISPLIALMKDQVDSLNNIGIPATFINSSITPQEALNRLEQSKTGVYKILYIAPERFYNQDFINAIQNIKVSLFAIDEAHCISQWGHDFRPSYTRLKNAIAFLKNPPVVALTATATPEVKEDIIKQLGLINPKIITTGFARPNLKFAVIQSSGLSKIDMISKAVSSVNGDSGIIYVGTRAKADELVEVLLDLGVDAVVYHAGMSAEDRIWVQENFMTGKAKVVVATNAFGLGIDKENIRFVIHHDMPGTIEAYYQEAGRAGRDGKESFCLLFYSPQDRYLREFFIKGDNPPPEIILDIYEILLGYESDSVLITYSDLSGSLSENIPDMAIGTALKILEKQGLISRPNEKTANAFFKLTSTFEKALSAIPKRAKKQIEILHKLHKTYGKELDEGWRFNLEDASIVIDAKKETMRKVLKSLRELGLAEYEPPFKGTEVRILKRVEREKIDINFDELNKKEKTAYARLDEMENYIYHSGCRQKYILDYFSDPNSRNCGKCDNCISPGTNTSRRNYYKPKYKSKWAKKEKPTEFKVDPPGEKPILSTKLTQLETLELYNDGLSIDKIAKIRKVDEKIIKDHIDFLKKKKLIKS